MTDNELFTAVRSAVLAGLTARGRNGWKVTRKYQPSQRGVNSAPTVYLFKVADKRHGSPKQTNRWDDLTATMFTTELQQYETTFQLSALVTETEDPTALTPSDAINEVCDMMQTEDGLASLRASGVGVLRVGNVGNSYDVNDRDEFAAQPSFDLVLTYQRSRTIATPAVVSIDPNLNRV